MARVIHNSPSEFSLLLIDDAHYGATLKVAPYFNYTRCQQACFTLDEGRSCSLIYDDCGFDAGGECNPSPPAFQTGCRQEERPHILASEDSINDAGEFTAPNYGSAARVYCYARRFQF